MKNELNREFCYSILSEYTKTPGLIRHAVSVETCLRAYARKFNQNEEYWGNTGLLHDFDYEMYPEEGGHPFKGAAILAEKGFEQEFTDTILSHVPYDGVPPRTTLLRKVLFACDELSGFITAVKYVKPGKSFEEVDASSVIKKMKDKAFARAVNRDDIRSGAELLQIQLEDHINFCIDALKNNPELRG